MHPKVGSPKLNALRGYPKNENVISLGPLTDLVKLQKKVSIKKVMVMGGALFNATADPEAVYLNFFPKDAKWIRGDVEVILRREKRGKQF